MYAMNVIDLGNNRYQINGEDVYAPNMHTAKVRFCNKYPEYTNNFQIELANKNKEIKTEVMTEELKNSKLKQAHERHNRGERMFR